MNERHESDFTRKKLVFNFQVLIFLGSFGCLCVCVGGGGYKECKFGRYCRYSWGKFSLCGERHVKRVNIVQC